MTNYFNKLKGTILRVTTRYNNLYPYDVYVEGFFPEGDQDQTISISTQIPSDLNIKYKLRGGFGVELFLSLQEYLGFGYILVPEVGPYNFSLAEDKSIDIFVGSYGLLMERTTLVDPTFVIGQSRIVALINHHFETSTQEIFTLPFNKTLWCWMGLFFLLSFILISFIGWMSKTAFSDNTIHFISIVLHKDCLKKCCKPSLRLAMCVMSMSVLVIMVSYTGNMVSIKSVGRFSLHSIQEVVESSYKILLELGSNHSAIRVMLEGLSHLPFVSKLLNRINEANFEYHSFEQMIRQVHENPSVYIIDEETGISSIEKELGHFPCSWSVMPVLGLKYPWVMYMRKTSIHRASINYGLLRHDETGVTKRLRKKWIPHAAKYKWNSFQFTQIHMDQIYSAFFIILIGFLCSIAWLFLVELKCLSGVFFGYSFS